MVVVMVVMVVMVVDIYIERIRLRPVNALVVMAFNWLSGRSLK